MDWSWWYEFAAEMRRTGDTIGLLLAPLVIVGIGVYLLRTRGEK